MLGLKKECCSNCHVKIKTVEIEFFHFRQKGPPFSSSASTQQMLSSQIANKSIKHSRNTAFFHQPKTAMKTYLMVSPNTRLHCHCISVDNWEKNSAHQNITLTSVTKFAWLRTLLCIEHTFLKLFKSADAQLPIHSKNDSLLFVILISTF